MSLSFTKIEYTTFGLNLYSNKQDLADVNFEPFFLINVLKCKFYFEEKKLLLLRGKYAGWICLWLNNIWQYILLFFFFKSRLRPHLSQKLNHQISGLKSVQGTAYSTFAITNLFTSLICFVNS